MNIEKYIETFARDHSQYTSISDAEFALDWLRTTLTAVAEEAIREERANLVEWMTNAKGVYSAHDVRMSFISYINALNDREDSTK
jgi:hypothetical protein